jgi:hypothetical protein
VPPSMDEPGIAERGESIQGRDRVADAMHDCLERPEPLLLTPEQESQDEALDALGGLWQVVDAGRRRRNGRARVDALRRALVGSP